jgi:hypothetical protein
MILKKTCFTLSLLFLPNFLSAEESSTVPVQLRAVLHDTVKLTANLFVIGDGGEAVRIELRPKNLSHSFTAQTVDGALSLYDQVVIDPKKPEVGLAATCKIPVGTKRGIVIILPSPADTKPPYRIVFIDDSAKAFPKGESRILTLFPRETAIEVGEHRFSIIPGKITPIPPVRKVNDFHVAQTNFYLKQDEKWSAFSHSQMQYLDKVRRIFIVYATPKTNDPCVITISDTTPIR